MVFNLKTKKLVKLPFLKMCAIRPTSTKRNILQLFQYRLISCFLVLVSRDSDQCC